MGFYGDVRISARDACQLFVSVRVPLDEMRRHAYVTARGFPRGLRPPERAQSHSKRGVLKILVRALPWSGESIDIDYVRVTAGGLVREPFEIALKKDVLHIRLLAVLVIFDGNHVIRLPRHKRMTRRENHSIPDRRVLALSISVAGRPTA